MTQEANDKIRGAWNILTVMQKERTLAGQKKYIQDLKGHLDAIALYISNIEQENSRKCMEYDAVCISLQAERLVTKALTNLIKDLVETAIS